MKLKIIKFYRDKGIPISKLIDRKPPLKPEQIEEAAVEVFDEIQNGLKIKDQDIPRYVWNKAHALDADKYKKERLLIFNYDKKVGLLAKKYKRNHKELKRLRSLPLIKEMERIKCLAGILSAVTIFYVVFKFMGYFK